MEAATRAQTNGQATAEPALESFNPATGDLVGAVPKLEPGDVQAVVDDTRRGIGVGSLLTEAVASLALRRGATHMKATMDARNEAMLRLMERQGHTVRTHEDDTIVAYTRLEPQLRTRSAA